jgi:hypothetical protein
MVRDTVAGVYSQDVADGMQVLYGGSVKPDNVEGLMAKENIDGGLVGGASLKADSFGALIDAAAAEREVARARPDGSKEPPADRPAALSLYGRESGICPERRGGGTMRAPDHHCSSNSVGMLRKFRGRGERGLIAELLVLEINQRGGDVHVLGVREDLASGHLRVAR